MSKFRVTIPHSGERSVGSDLETRIRKKVESIPEAERQNIHIRYDKSRTAEYQSLEQIRELYRNYGGPIIVSYSNHSETPRETKRTRQSPEKIYDLLRVARIGDDTLLTFKDGRTVSGALVFNPSKGSGRIINVDQEVSVDFTIEEIDKVRYK